jgi:ribosomal protein L39E
MSKKSSARKMKLGNKLKQSRRIPLLAVLRTHRKIESNMFARDWRHRKLRIKE